MLARSDAFRMMIIWNWLQNKVNNENFLKQYHNWDRLQKKRRKVPTNYLNHPSQPSSLSIRLKSSVTVPTIHTIPFVRFIQFNQPFHPCEPTVHSISSIPSVPTTCFIHSYHLSIPTIFLNHPPLSHLSAHPPVATVRIAPSAPSISPNHTFCSAISTIHPIYQLLPIIASIHSQEKSELKVKNQDSSYLEQRRQLEEQQLQCFLTLKLHRGKHWQQVFCTPDSLSA